jgi:hypothetical protein
MFDHPGWKGLPGKGALAYRSPWKVTMIIKFSEYGPGIILTKPVVKSSMEYSFKEER